MFNSVSGRCSGGVARLGNHPSGQSAAILLLWRVAGAAMVAIWPKLETKKCLSSIMRPPSLGASVVLVLVIRQRQGLTSVKVIATVVSWRPGEKHGSWDSSKPPSSPNNWTILKDEGSPN